MQQDHDQHGQAPHHQQRAEVLDRRDRDAEEAPRAHDHDLARVAQVAGQEDDQADLGELGRLEDAQARDAHAEIGAVDLFADAGQPGQDEQADRARRRSV